MTLKDKLFKTGKKRLLSLDGGGIRGLVTLGYLSRMETILRKRYKNPDLVLSDYFDLIGGTSTGAVIATLLSLGWSVGQIKEMYMKLATEVFQPKDYLFGPIGRLLGAKFSTQPLEKIFRETFGGLTLGSDEFKTGLLIVAKRADTGSVWAMINVPGNKYYDMNKDILIWELLRASTAAPTYFKPQKIGDVGFGKSAIFIDGAVSMHHNPSLLLMMVANLKGYGLNWLLGDDNLSLCSVGTGHIVHDHEIDDLQDKKNIGWAPVLLSQMINDSTELVQTMLQWMSDSPTACSIDSQIEHLHDDRVTMNHLLHYIRYDIDLTQEVLSEFGLNYTQEEITDLCKLDDVNHKDDLIRIGEVAAEQQMKPDHFTGHFDI